MLLSQRNHSEVYMKRFRPGTYVVLASYLDCTLKQKRRVLGYWSIFFIAAYCDDLRTEMMHSVDARKIIFIELCLHTCDQ